MAQIKTTGQLRQFLADTLVAVKNGQMDPDKARNITKIAAQINESIYSEIKTARVMDELGRQTAEMGNLKIGEDAEVKQAA
jgi:hypothetical protein